MHGNLHPQKRFIPSTYTNSRSSSLYTFSAYGLPLCTQHACCVLSYLLCFSTSRDRAFDMVWRKGLVIELKKTWHQQPDVRLARRYPGRENVSTFKCVWVRRYIADPQTGKRHGAGCTNISPLAFISMMDHLPDSLENVEWSLFADDSAILKGGRSRPTLVKLVHAAVSTRCDFGVGRYVEI
jgi:hypothetical protein